MMKVKKLLKSAKILKSLGNVKRLEIVYHLQDGEKRVCELEKLMNISQSALSQHLAILRAARIVVTRRSAQSIYYSLADAKCQEILMVLNELYA